MNIFGKLFKMYMGFLSNLILPDRVHAKIMQNILVTYDSIKSCLYFADIVIYANSRLDSLS